MTRSRSQKLHIVASRQQDADKEAGARVRPPVIAKSLRRDILNGKFPPGAWLRERQLAEQFDVSRGPIREAFRLLSEERLVEFEPFKGARVTRLNRDEITEMFELRAALIALAARLAATRASDAAIQQFAAEIDALVKMAESGASAGKLVTQGGRATAILVEACAAADVQTMHRQIIRKSQWHYTQVGIDNVATAMEAGRYWREVVASLSKRDPDAAERAVKRVLRHVQTHALAALDDAN